jgi:hypothetical protein
MRQILEALPIEKLFNRSTGTAPGLESEASQLRPWGGLWISVALACLAAAIWQWVELAG